MTTFTNQIAREIEARFPSDEKFTKYDFLQIAKGFGKNDKSVSYVLCQMEKKNLLSIVGKMPVKRGGTRPSNIYARVLGVKLVNEKFGNKFSKDEWQREINKKAAFANQCGIRLHEVLDGMTNARLGA